MMSQDIARCPGLLTKELLILVAPCVDCRRRTEPAAGPWQVHMQPLAWQPSAGDWRCVKRLEPLPAAVGQVA